MKTKASHITLYYQPHFEKANVMQKKTSKRSSFVKFTELLHCNYYILSLSTDDKKMFVGAGLDFCIRIRGELTK